MNPVYTKPVRPLLIFARAEYLSREQCLLLDDGQSVGAVYSISPVASEGRTAARLEEIRDSVEDALQDSLEEFDSNPWVVQFLSG